MPKAPQKPDSAYIQTMFDRLAGRYNLFNSLISFGLDRHWRNETLKPVENGMRVLDLGCGTGDLALGAARKAGSGIRVTGLDFSPEMLRAAEKRKELLGLDGSVRFVRGRAEDLPVESEPYDVAVSGFVLRSLYENVDAILKGVHRSLKPGGQVSFLDLTEPCHRVLRALWKLYMNSLVAFWGWLVFGKDYPQFYFTDSARRFVKPPEFEEKLKSAGFEAVRTKFFMFGSIALYQARKPS